LPSTLGGNSGSAVIDVDSGEVVALHFSGEYLKANYTVPMYEPARDRRVAPKLNFDGSVAPANDWEPAWLSLEGPQASASPPQPVSPPVAGGSSLQSPSGTQAAPIPEGSTTLTVPLRIRVEAGQPSA
jgi:endonuclease G, mitochondrial